MREWKKIFGKNNKIKELILLQLNKKLILKLIILINKLILNNLVI